MTPDSRRPFLTAEWRYLTMLNYTVESELLAPYLPAGTELDTWNNLHTVSLVAFHFRNTRVLGIPIPFHRHFEEVNLRFYVRCQSGGELRRGVVFIRELVPRFFIAATARLIYNEQYYALPMHHQFAFDPEDSTRPTSLNYQWGRTAERCSLNVSVSGAAKLAASGSEIEFITEHYWGYTRQRNGSTLQYRVDHPRWHIWNTVHPTLEGNFQSFYGDKLGHIFHQSPRSAFVAEGSAVSVFPGVPL